MSLAIDSNILLQTKIRPPALRGGLCKRPRLLDQLERMLATRLTLVQAPAGYGKTTFLLQCAELLSQRNEAVAWVTFDRTDNRPDLALAYLCAAFGRHDPAVNERMAGQLDRLCEGGEIMLVCALINALGGCSRNILLILDDVHSISNPVLHDCLRFFVQNSPNTVRTVLSSREVLPWGFDHLPDPGEIALIDAGVLKFTASETLDLIKAAGGCVTDEGIQRALIEKAEGWAAGIQLLLSSLGKPAFGIDIDSGQRGDKHMLFDYLGSAVLARQDEEIQSFLVQTAPLGRFTVELCEAVTGNRSAHRIIRTLADRNLFLVPLDDNREWFRYHALFAEFLLNRLEQERAHDRKHIHAAASRWFESKGLAMEALQHALAAEDTDHIAPLLDAAARQSVRYSQLNLLVGWLEQLPGDAILRAGVNATLAVIWAYILTRRFDKAQGLIAKVESILEGGERPVHGEISPQDKPCLELAKIALERFLDPHRDQSARINEIRSRLGANWNLERALADRELGYSYWRSNELEKAYVSMLEARAQAEAARSFFLMADIMSLLAEIRLQQGRLADSQRLCEEVAARYSTSAGEPIPASGFAYLILAEIHYEQDRIEAAVAALRTADCLNRQRNSPDLLLRGRLLEAKIATIGLEPVQHADYLLQIANTDIHEKSSEAANLLYGMQISALSRARNLDAAEAMLLNHGMPVRSPRPPASCANSPAEEPLYLALGIYHLESGRFAAALNWFRHLIKWHRVSGREIAHARAISLVALCCHAQGRTQEAMHYLREATHIGERLGLSRTLTDLGGEMRVLMSQYCDLREKQGREMAPCADYVQKLLGRSSASAAVRSRQHGPRVAAAGQTATAEPGQALSRRESEVLQLIGQGMNNREIGMELLIAVTSVKWHVKNILAKLQASSRTQALARARKAGIVS